MPDRTADDQILVHRQLAQAEEHFASVGEVVAFNRSPLLLQSEQVLRPRVGDHPFTPSHSGNLQGLIRLPVPAPTLERLETADGVIWRVTYAGMVRDHRQDWQAFTFYEMACALYAAQSTLGQDRPT